MSYFVIAGMPECCMFNHVRLIADILSDHLPNFKVNFIQLDPPQWKNYNFWLVTTNKIPSFNKCVCRWKICQTWIKEKNLTNGWYHLSSPIVWKELTLQSGKAHLIGGASEFWEYCYDYYNLESLLNNEELYKLVEDSKQYNESREEIEIQEKVMKEEMIILIKSNKNKGNIIPVILMRLLQRVGQFRLNHLIIRVLKDDDVIYDTEELSVFEATVEIVDGLVEGLINADLLIIVGDYTREKDEDLYSWLERNKVDMEIIAEHINLVAKKCLRVIVGVHGPACFNATILIENVTKIHLHNIVAETCYVGLEPLKMISQIIQMPLEDLSGPPVWGFIGINQIIDLEHVVQRYDVYRPNIRAVKNSFGSTLQLGKKHTELRYLSYMSDKLKTVWLKLKHKSDRSQYLYKINRLAKVRGIMTIIDNWYKPNCAGNIISVGILSNGSFDIPAGIVFSQPAILQNGRWTPMKTFPVPRKDPCGIEDLVPFILEIYRHFKIRENVI